MSFVTREIIAAAVATLGEPHTLALRYEILPEELAMIRASQKHGRVHDVTTALHAGAEVLVIAKHSYPPGIFRVPGGGLQPGEPMIAGGVREALEETGLPFTPDRYLLRVMATFTQGADSMVWTTHVLCGRAPRLEPAPIDRREIREARWVTWQDLVGPIARLMEGTGRPLLAYRAALHQAMHAAVAVPRSVQDRST